MIPEDAEWQTIYEGVQQADETACRRFWDAYAPLIEQFAQRNMGRHLQPRVGPESIMISACRTFFRRAQQDEFELNDTQSLWNLLCAITINKIRQQARHHGRQKRGLDREVRVEKSDTADESRPYEIAGRQISPELLAEFEDEFQNILAQLPEDEATVLQLKLEELTNDEIAERMQCSERSVRRITQKLQSRLQGAFDRSG